MFDEVTKLLILGKVDNRDGPSSCWLWKGRADSKGYGLLSVKGKTLGAHRAMLMLSKAVPFDRAMACHTCDNPPCVNPAHLWWGTAKDNARDAAAKGRLPFQKKSHCKHGHPFNSENTYRNARGQRQCRTCQTRMRRKGQAASRARAALKEPS